MHTSIFSMPSIIGLILIALSPQLWANDTNTPEWDALKPIYFGDRPIRADAEDLLTIEAPFRAEDAAIVPISIKTHALDDPERYVQNLHLIIDKNPMPYSANIALNPSLGPVEIDTRMRVQSYSTIRAVAELDDGSLHMVSTFVRASGGCSAPAMKDAELAMARLGTMQLRMRDTPIGEPVLAQVIVSHPNYSGLQFDQQRRIYIPAHFVENITIQYNDETLMDVQAGISMSEDPSIRFRFTPTESGTLKAMVRDSNQQVFTIEKAL